MTKYRDNWDTYFMKIVYLIATRSLDESTNIGAVIVGTDNQIVSTGYNSFPYGVLNLPYRQKRPTKYKFFEHAERNAIYLAARSGNKVGGCKMYTNGIPCTDCARAIIQSGITEVIVDKNWADESVERWIEEAKQSKIMFREADIMLREVEIEIPFTVYNLKNGIINDGAKCEEGDVYP